jgi:hypothetical protein
MKEVNGIIICLFNVALEIKTGITSFGKSVSGRWFIFKN